MSYRHIFIILLILGFICAWYISKEGVQSLRNASSTGQTVYTNPKHFSGRKVYYANKLRSTLSTKRSSNKMEATHFIKYNKVKNANSVRRRIMKIAASIPTKYNKEEVTKPIPQTTEEMEVSRPTEYNVEITTPARSTTTEMEVSGPTEYNKLETMTHLHQKLPQK